MTDVKYSFNNKIQDIILPVERSSLIMELIGFPEEFRMASKKKYDELLAKQEMKYSSRISKRLVLASDSRYAFAFYDYILDYELLPVAAYVKRITNKELVNIIGKLNMNFPRPISEIKEIMKYHLGFTDSLITEALKL